MKKSLITLITTIILATALPAQTVAVMDFTCDDFAFYDKVAVMTDLLRHELVKNGNVTLVERKEIELVKDEMKFQLEGWTDPATVKETGKMLNADCIIVGSVACLGCPLYITARMIEVESAKVLHSAKMSLNVWSEYEQKLPAFARDCVDKMPVPEYFPGTWLGMATAENGTDYEYEITLEKGTKATVKVTASDASGKEETQVAVGSYSYTKDIFRLNVTFKKPSIKEVKKISWTSAYVFADKEHTTFNVVVAPDGANAKKVRVSFSKSE